MSYLLDTNFISETMKPRPDPEILRWMRTADPHDLYLSVLTLGEVCCGVDLLAPGRRKQQLEVWIATDLPDWFDGRILPIDAAIADQFGRLGAESKRKGWGLEAVNALIAATAQVHNLTLATSNRRHFEKLGVRLLSF